MMSTVCVFLTEYSLSMILNATRSYAVTMFTICVHFSASDEFSASFLLLCMYGKLFWFTKSFIVQAQFFHGA